MSTLSAQSTVEQILDSLWMNKPTSASLRIASLEEFVGERLDSARYLETNIFLLKEGYNIAVKYDLPQEQARLQLMLGDLYFGQADFNQSLIAYKSSLAAYNVIQDTVYLISLKNIIGNNYLRLDNTTEAVRFYLEALKLAVKIDYQPAIAPINGNLGLVYQNLGEHQNAIKYFTRNQSIYKAEKNYNSLLISYNNTGHSYLETEAYDLALDFYHRALAIINDQLPASAYIGIVYANLGIAHTEMNQNDSAFHYLHLALPLLRSSADKRKEAIVLHHLGKAHRSNSTDSVWLYTSDAFAIAQQNGYTAEVMEFSKSLIELYENAEDFEGALAIYGHYTAARDTIRQRTNFHEIFDAEAEYQFTQEKWQKEQYYLERINTQKHHRRLISALLVLLTLSLLISGIYLIRRRTHRADRERLALIDKLQSLKEASVAIPTTSTCIEQKEAALHRDKIEKAIGRSLSESSWKLLVLIAANPTITNQELATVTGLKKEGVSTSLRRMYKLFDIQTTSKKNKKIALLTKVTELSDLR